MKPPKATGDHISVLAKVLRQTPDVLLRVLSNPAAHVETYPATIKGKRRQITEATGPLKEIQRALKSVLLDVPINRAIHGYVTGRSTITTARMHVKHPFLGSFDIQDFFPSIRQGRVVALFKHLGYSENVANALGRLPPPHQ